MDENKKKLYKKLKKEGRRILDKYSYEDLINASDNQVGEEELLKCLNDIFISIIQDWVQEYIDKRRKKYIKYLNKELNKETKILE